MGMHLDTNPEGRGAEIERFSREVEELRRELANRRALEVALEPVAYVIRGTAKGSPRDAVRIEARDQKDGSRKWVVCQAGEVLNKKGHWEWEPLPSSRTDNFLQRTRFDSPQEALAAHLRFVSCEEN